MISIKLRKKPDIKVGDCVLFWTDNERWRGTAKVVEAGEKILKLAYNEKTITSSLKRVQNTRPPYLLEEFSSEEEMPKLPDIEQKVTGRLRRNMVFVLYMMMTTVDKLTLIMNFHLLIPPK